ncbi:hypothetical protein [Tomitella fengzijianii]|uniref:Uncharacterized protein n=1 Tax=Tomitella fengzijianii TaxID=2597660 RepID=A0A516X0W3_9ACTN|nr:hypothetical protein [Tomitella fengzijianii]QDQ96708.1 hypothetical protein FO059_04325 [Tomitella fengzijianii]
MTGLSPAGRTVDGGSDNRAETIAHLRRRMAALHAVPSPGDGQGVRPVREPEVPRNRPARENPARENPIPAPARTAPARTAPTPAPNTARPLATLPGLAGILPAGGIERGAVTSLSGSRALLVGLLAEVTAHGGCAAVVGHPGLGLLAAVEMGADLARIALVPDPGADHVGVAAVLLDGMDLVVLDLAGASVPPSRSRAVVARARSHGAALVVTGGEWEGAAVRIDARVGAYEGLGAGRGRVHGMRLDVRARGRAFPARSGAMVLRHRGGGTGWTAGHPEPTAGEARRGA